MEEILWVVRPKSGISFGYKDTVLFEKVSYLGRKRNYISAILFNNHSHSRMGCVCIATRLLKPWIGIRCYPPVSVPLDIQLTFAAFESLHAQQAWFHKDVGERGIVWASDETEPSPSMSEVPCSTLWHHLMPWGGLTHQVPSFYTFSSLQSCGTSWPSSFFLSF